MSANETAAKIAARIKNAGEWNPDDCKALCDLAGLSDEWDSADGDNFESVVERAADILRVEIY